MSESKKSKKHKEHRSSNFIAETRYGRWVSIGFFRENAWILIAILAAVISLMGLRYQTKTRMASIKELNEELRKTQSLMLREKAAYMSIIRETEMRRLIEEKGMGLIFQEQPPFEITTD